MRQGAPTVLLQRLWIALLQQPLAPPSRLLHPLPEHCPHDFKQQIPLSRIPPDSEQLKLRSLGDEMDSVVVRPPRSC